MADDKLEANRPNTGIPLTGGRETVRPQPREAGPFSQNQASGDLDRTPAPPRTQPTASNNPQILSILYLVSLLVGITGLIALVLAIVWKGGSREPWEISHYDYQIRTGLIWIGEVILGFFFLLTIIGFPVAILLLLGATVHLAVRAVMSLIRAGNREAMPQLGTWLA